MSIDDDLINKGYSLHTWSNGPNFWYPVHDHPYDKVIVCREGSITFYLPASQKEIVMNVGDRMDIPAGTSHSVTVGPQGVTCLEAQKTR